LPGQVTVLLLKKPAFFVERKPDFYPAIIGERGSNATGKPGFGATFSRKFT
jgi:hypothetical protein